MLILVSKFIQASLQICWPFMKDPQCLYCNITACENAGVYTGIGLDKSGYQLNSILISP